TNTVPRLSPTLFSCRVPTSLSYRQRRLPIKSIKEPRLRNGRKWRGRECLVSTDTNGARRKLSGFKTDLVTDGALEFLEQAKNGPFYLLVPFYAPHTPYDFQPDAYRKPHLDSKFSSFPDDPMHPWQNAGLTAHHGRRES